jgi:hypothetical protein
MPQLINRLTAVVVTNTKAEGLYPAVPSRWRGPGSSQPRLVGSRRDREAAQKTMGDGGSCTEGEGRPPPD